MAESDEEWDEAKKENERLIELGETPVVTIEEYPVITDIKEMLEYDCKDSEAALPEMSKCLAMFDDDYVTKHMIQQFIVDEQEKSVTQGHAFLFFWSGSCFRHGDHHRNRPFFYGKTHFFLPSAY